MVSSITPGTTGVATLGVDPRFSKHHPRSERADGSAEAGADRVQLSDAASWRAASDSVAAGLDQIRQALSLGEEAKDFLDRMQSLANSDDPSAPGQLAELVSRFAERVDAAVTGGLGVVAGKDVSVQAEPNSPPVAIAGADLRLKSDPQPGDVFSFSSDAAIGPDLADAVRASRTALNAELDRLADAARALETHQGFLGAAASGGVRGDLDADSARLLALQVRQGLNDLGGASIVNVEPQAVLALFKS
ncbi:MAG TPA: hypothetical protein VG841_02045 [Caulobacterales bacterium]|nr:hypothetical protein [Caulobacterales bacterium]